MIESSPRWKHSIETLWDLETTRVIHRFHRLQEKIRSPRQAIGIVLAVGFILLYLLVGLTILARRDTVDPERLQLWLSGGMVVYAIYHGLKYLFASSPDGKFTSDPATAAFGLWIGGGPIPRHLVALHDGIRLVPATAMKTSLLCVVLYRDVPSLVFLWVGVFGAMFSLEWIRRMVSLVVDSMDARERKITRFAGGLVALALITQWGLKTWNAVPGGSDPAEYMASGIGVLADFAMSDPVQILAAPFQAASHLAVSRPFAWAIEIVPASWMPIHCMILLLFVLASLATLLWSCAALDQWSLDRRHTNEQSKLRRLASYRSRPNGPSAKLRRVDDSGRAGVRSRPVFALATRQWHCLSRYRLNVFLSFAIPMVLSLSPLLTRDRDFSGQFTKQWIFVVGGIALSTLLLAPPALQIDFRRDLKRMWLLKSLPLSSLDCCIGMLAVPVLITSLFQWATLAAAYAIAAPPIAQVIWLAAALPALALMTFATENALFLAFPHHIHDQGIAMVIRAKVTFLWKGLILAMFPVVLYVGSLGCLALFPASVNAVVIPVGSVVGFWILAGLTLLACDRCWDRFRPVDDVPGEV